MLQDLSIEWNVQLGFKEGAHWCWNHSLFPPNVIASQQNRKLAASQRKEKSPGRPDDCFLQLIKIMVSRLWFQVFLSLKLTSPMTWIMLFGEMAFCSAYSHSAVQFGHSGYQIIKLLKLICFTEQIKLLGSFRKKQQSNLFSPRTSSGAAFWKRVLQSGSSNYFIANLRLNIHISSSSQLSAGQSA